MSELFRLLRFARPYWAALIASTLLMAGVGAGQALVVLLVRSVFDRVLRPDSPDSAVLLVTIPVFQKAVYLQSLVPSYFHNVWTMVAVAILAVFFFKGLCDYLGNYPGQLRRPLRRHRSSPETSSIACVHQDAQFFESNSTGRVMSSIMNDIEKIQVAISHMLADWLRQSFTAVWRCCSS